MTMLVGSLYLLAACRGSVPGDVPLPPAALLVPCDLPVKLPGRDATQAEVERWWGSDRAALRECG